MPQEKPKQSREDSMGRFVSMKVTGDFKKTTKFLNYMSGGKYLENVLKRYGDEGIEALSNATPRDTGKTSESWYYEIEHDKDHCQIAWFNSEMAGGVPLVILIQYGHATKNGGYIQGIDFINPAIRPIFNKILDEVWKEVVNA